MEPALASHVMLAFAIGLRALGLLDPQGADWGQVAEGGMEILLQGLEKKESVFHGLLDMLLLGLDPYCVLHPVGYQIREDGRSRRVFFSTETTQLCTGQLRE